MHLLSASCAHVLLLAALLRQVRGLDSVIGLYGEAVEIPCNIGAIKVDDILMTKWKYDKGQGLSGDLLVKQTNQDVVITATDEYKGRVNLTSDLSLRLSEAKLTDERIFTCMVVKSGNIAEYPVDLMVHKSPVGLEISDKAEELEIGKLTKLGTCVARDANPAANITWLKNSKPLVADGKEVVIEESVQGDSDSGLSTTTSTLKYTAKKEDTEAQFTCIAEHPVVEKLVAPPVTMSVTYSTENIILQVIPQDALVEGDNLTLKCVADGNPAPTSFIFYLKGQLEKVENADTFSIINVSRDTAGEYKCALMNDPTMEASKNVTVNYLDVNLIPSGSIVKHAGDALDLALEIVSSSKHKVSWTKDGVKLNKEPKFIKLAFSDAGNYQCEVTTGALSRRAAFELVVEGAPVIRQLSKHRSEDGQHKVLICEAEGSPKPAVSWSINGTSLNEGSFVNGKITHKITVVPSANLTVFCTVSNEFGIDTKAINVSSHQSEDGDQTKLVVGVVVGLLVAALVIALAYWVYMKKSKQGSWKTGEKENGSSEEEKKLEEKVEENSQKAEV
ncbi:CD166 antigen homolog isoform X2 [Cololabis saira]|uniref:CD166 antigen homolog isoform X2 n=1 Tax=Cololabis saira TaxID=129043 RepID=UPI002AD41A60|nr:CD166 antigen homolog isoform X2 [Cololabis saira]